MKLKNVSFILAGLCLMSGLVLLNCPNTDDTGDNGGSTETPLIKITAAVQFGGIYNASNNTAAASSTEIRITFSAAVSDLLQSEVEVTGAAEINNAPQQQGSAGTGWRIPITVNAYGTAQVIIHKKGIDDSAKSVVVYRQGAEKPNTYTVQANGSSGAASTRLTFDFEEDVTLLAENISVTDMDGRVTIGNLTGGNKQWVLAISVIAEGDISVTINQTGVDSVPQLVRVFASEGGSFTNPVPQSPIDPQDPYTKTKKNVVSRSNGTMYTPVVNEVWMGIDTNTDPRCPIGYKLMNSGKQFFENVVIFHSDLQWDHLAGDLYAENFVNDQNIRGGQPANIRGFCPKTAPHHHEPSRLQWLLANFDEYLQPIKDAGMRLLICPLPAGQGYSYGHIGAWPGSSGAPTGSGGGWSTVMGEQGAVKFAEELVDWCLQWGFDGIALDDEYADAGTGASHRNTGYSNYNSTAYANIVRWLKYFKAISAAKGYVDPITGKAGMWVSVFDYRFTLPSSVIISSTQAGYSPVINGTRAVTAGTYQTRDIVDIAYPSQYGPSYSSRPAGLTASQWCHITVAFDAFSAVTTPPSSVKAMATTMLTSGYGCTMYFALRERSFYAGRDYFMNGMGSQAEYWLTEMSKVLYRDGVYYDGPDFMKFPTSISPYDDVKYTGALYKAEDPGKTVPLYP